MKKISHLNQILASVIVATVLWIGSIGIVNAETFCEVSGTQGGNYFNGNSGNYGQCFIPTENYELYNIYAYFENGSGTPNKSIVAKLYDTPSGHPTTGSLIATSSSVNETEITNNSLYNWTKFELPSGQPLLHDTRYCVYFQRSESTGGNNVLEIKSSNSNNGCSIVNNYLYYDYGETANYYLKIKLDTDAPYTAPSIGITYPVDQSTTKAEYWTVDVAMNDATTTDSISSWVCFGTNPACSGYSTITECMADSDCLTDHKVITDCDSATSTYDGTTNITLFNTLTNESTYYAKAFLFASDKVNGFCAGNSDSALIATSNVIWFEYSSNYLSGLDDADTFWAGSFGNMWGAATSTPGYTYGKNIIDSVTKPILNIAAGWSSIFQPNQATDWGVEGGENLKIAFQKITALFNIIPGFQLLTILFIAIIVDIGIFLYKLIWKTKKFAS